MEQNNKENEVLKLLRSSQSPKIEPVIVEKWTYRLIAVIVFGMLVILMGLVNTKVDKSLDYFIGAFATISFIYFIFKLILSFFYTPVKAEPNRGYKVSVVMPSYNEDSKNVINSIQCLLNQDYPIHEIIFIDDGSTDESAYNDVSSLAKHVNDSKDGRFNNIRIIVHRLEKNMGKKQAQAWGFRKAEGDVIMLVDSDGYIYPDALRELLKPLNDEKVTSVVGHINARNHNESFIARLQDILYHSAFRVGRAAQSITNCVLVCSGALSIHRRSVIIDHLDEFLEDKVLGIKCEAGDDRCLTNISLKYGGKTKYQSTAQCVTDVPKTTKKFFIQQVRWAKSYFLYTIESLKHAWKRPFMALWLLGEGFIWIFFSVSTLLSVLNFSQNFAWILLIYSVCYMILSTLMNGIYYLFKNPLVFLLAPLFALAHMLLLFPIRIYALLTITKSSWGTR